MKISTYSVAAILLLCTYSSVSFGNEDTKDIATLTLHFYHPEITTIDEYLQLNLNTSNGMLCHAGKPVLPLYTMTLEYPFGTHVTNVQWTLGSRESQKLTKKIVPAPSPYIPGLDKKIPDYTKDSSIYLSEELYPETWVRWFIGGGLDQNNTRKTFLTITVFPIRYSPATDTIQYTDKINLDITVQNPEKPPQSLQEGYKLVVIAPTLFVKDLQPLVDHKNSRGMQTLLKPVEEIYEEYQGRDKPEQIKYFIKDAIEQWNCTYILLVGGMKSLLCGKPRDDSNQGSKDWYIPVRYTNLVEIGKKFDPGFISDLYYADVYTAEGNFSSWDSNNDGVFAKWRIPGLGRDILDFYPDVYVGRLPCRNTAEVKIMVNKIISYESASLDPSWFRRMVVVGGDVFDDVDTDFVEGELVCEKALSFMTNFTPVKLYASNRDISTEYTPLTSNIAREISVGCGHLLFGIGHGSPWQWVTFWPNDFTSPIGKGGLNVYDLLTLHNDQRLPICVSPACHNAQFNVTFLSTLLNRPYSWTYGVPTAECWSWHITRKINGGSIATLGNTGLGYGAGGEVGDRDGDGINEPDIVEALCGYLERCFYQCLAKEDHQCLGDAWGGSIRNYLQVYPGMDFQWDAKVVQEWTLIGDPSLMVGGKGDET
jgi:hypothetical protein